ncbi:MAG: hypothetical protein EOP50_05975 [Sphingobacteriales bacterium]|nr:MAG: hypothetical protein EOP50_05975 [Sphingobacteriales bacterium]
MSLAITYRAEMLKSKRTAAFWMSIIGAAFIPVVFFLVYALKAEKLAPVANASPEPWMLYLGMGWNSLNSFLFPMYIILICALIPQIEFRNNAWKQVWASPQTNGNVFFGKFLSIHTLILMFFLSFTVLMITGALLANAIHSVYPFFSHAIDWRALGVLSLKTYLSILSISAIQYWLSLRFKSFVAPVGIGLALLVGALIATSFGWEHANKIPYAYPILSIQSMKGNHLEINRHEWYSLAYTAFFLGLAFLDLKLRKERG